MPMRRSRQRSYRGERGEWISVMRPDRLAARKLIVAELKEKGYLENRALPERRRSLLPLPDNSRALPDAAMVRRHGPLAEPAMQAVRDGRVRIIPEGWSNSYRLDVEHQGPMTCQI
jgi:valyl-tRNA synthetase